MFHISSSQYPQKEKFGLLKTDYHWYIDKGYCSFVILKTSYPKAKLETINQ